MLLKWRSSALAILSKAIRFNFYKGSEQTSKVNRWKYPVKRDHMSIIPEEDFNYYYRPKMSQIDEKSQQIITQMKSKNVDKQKLNQDLDSYLDFSKNRRSAGGLLIILTAVWQYRDDESWRKACIKNIVEFILRSYEISVFKLDRRNFPIVVKALTAKIKETSEKIKIGLIKSKLIEFIEINIDVLNPYELYTIMAPMTDIAKESTVSQKLKFVKLADRIQQKIHHFFLKRLRDETSQLQNQHLTYYSLKIINGFYHIFTPKHNAYVQSLYRILQKLVFADGWDNKVQVDKRLANGFFIYFPPLGRNQKGEYFRDLLLEKILKKKFEVGWKMQKFDFYDVLLYYNIVCFSFFKTMDNVQFRYNQDLNYLIKEDVKAPELHPFFWQSYSKQPEKVHRDAILCHIMKHIYPEKYIQTPQVNATTIIPFISDNQFKTRVDMVLEKLGINYETQVKVCERYVDFLIEGKIIIECDGLIHFKAHQMEYSQNSHFRNLHFILSGYNLIVLNIFEFSVNRQVQKLQVLIKSKLDLVKTRNAIIVI